jgi:hypothetical protein
MHHVQQPWLGDEHERLAADAHAHDRASTWCVIHERERVPRHLEKTPSGEFGGCPDLC